MLKIQFKTLFLKEEDGWSVLFPTLGGGTQGDTKEEALANAREALEFCYQSAKEDGREFPIPEINDIMNLVKENADYEEMTVETVEIKVADFAVKRINVSIPEITLEKIDGYLAGSKNKRSAFLAEAAEEYIARHRR